MHRAHPRNYQRTDIGIWESATREPRLRRARKEGNNYSMTECAYRTQAEVARRLSGHRSNQLQCCAKCSLPADGDRPAHRRNSIGNQWNSPKTTALLIPSGLNSIAAASSPRRVASSTRSISSRETPLSSSASTCRNQIRLSECRAKKTFE